MKINKINFNDILFKSNPIKIKLINSKIDREYFKVIISLGKFDYDKTKNYKIVFTPLHGASIMAIPEVLKLAGFKKINIVNEQSKPDGNFPTVKSPTPEEKEALSMAIEKAKKIKADIVIGTASVQNAWGLPLCVAQTCWFVCGFGSLGSLQDIDNNA